jgi:hypothetical protein
MKARPGGGFEAESLDGRVEDGHQPAARVKSMTQLTSQLAPSS